VRLDGLGDRLAQGCRTHAVPGAQVGLLRDGERAVLCEGTAEYGGRVRVDADTFFHAGSIAKAVTAMVVLDADARGELSVDVPLDRQSSASWDDTPLAIMAQTTGRPNDLPGDDESLEAFVARVGAAPRVHAAGRFSYSNAAWCALDLLLRDRVGRGFEDLARERVLGADARFGEPVGASTGHGVQPGGDPVVVPSAYSAAASAAGSRWWATADQLLDFAGLNLDLGAGRLDESVVRRMQQPHAVVPGATIADAWGLGWALWRRSGQPGHVGYGWAGFTGGHRAYLRCFPNERAALVVLANAAGPLFGPPGGSALFDDLLPTMLDVLGVAPLPEPTYAGSRSTDELAGRYGPLVVHAQGPDLIELEAQAFGAAAPLPMARSGGNTFQVAGRPPGAMPVAFDDDLVYLGPFAVPRQVR
jgi:CubicO group peptidase (beta-lactamase class C family)